MDCAAGAAGLVPGVKQAKAGYQGAKAVTTIAKNNKTKPGGAKADHQGSRRSPGCVTANSFVPGTLVLLANGQRKPIEQVELGDQVIATDPATGQTNPETVVATIVGHGDKTLVDITIHTDDGDGDGSAAVTATDGHPFWVANRGPDGRWIDAVDLQPGDLLLAPDGSHVRVLAIAAYGAVATVHNLTITNHHTYYITTDNTSALVHNCGGAPTRQVTALGKWQDIQGYLGKPGFNVLNLPWRGPGKWNWSRNKRFIDDAIKRGDDVRLYTNPTNPRYSGGNVYARELKHLERRGYTWEPRTGYWQVVPQSAPRRPVPTPSGGFIPV
jgi:hypothetical protein